MDEWVKKSVECWIKIQRKRKKENEQKKKNDKNKE